MGALDTLLATLGLRTTDVSVVGDREVKNQGDAVKAATKEGAVGAAIAIACSSTAVLGGCKLFPRFNASLSVSGKTALIVMPAFGAFFLLAELKLNEHKKMRRQGA